MIAILSSAKTMDMVGGWKAPSPTQPEYLDKGKVLLQSLQRLSSTEISRLMGVSAAIAKLNAERFAAFRFPFSEKNAKPALLAYQGDVFKNMGSAEFGIDDLAFAQKSLRILSGLYGVLRPLDLIQPYRLEMAIKLSGPSWKDLYAYWSDAVTHAIDRDARENGRCLVNLASQEYASAVDADKLSVPMFVLTFKQDRKGKVDLIPILAKRARGLMSRYLVTRRVTDPEKLKDFQEEDYRFEPKLSSKTEWVFVRRA